MQRIQETLDKMASHFDSLEKRFDAFDKRFDSIEDRLDKMTVGELTAKQKNALRRQHYREAKAQKMKGRIPLPNTHCFGDRCDRRLREKFPEWAKEGLKYGVTNRPEAFISWLVHQWNSKTYLKKPVTFSGSAFRVWTGHARHALGPGDLMHLYRKRRIHYPFLRTPEEWDDFSKRPMWNWTTIVVKGVVQEMRESPQWNGFHERFKRMLCLLAGGMVEMEVRGIQWDFYETQENINEMMKDASFLALWKPALEAISNGLLAKQMDQGS